MTDPIDYIINTTDGERSITIYPVTITPTSGVQYATGQYSLSEGVVGLGMLTFYSNDEWAFDGINYILSETDLTHIVEFIKRKDHTPAGLVDEAALIAEPSTVAPEVPVQTFDFVVENEGISLNVHVIVNYPLYDVTLDASVSVQMEQDHHSNWFLTQGKLNDRLVQAIGKRIAHEVTGI